MPITSTKQDLLHRKAERAAIVDAFQKLRESESRIYISPCDQNILGRRIWENLPKEVSDTWTSIADGKDYSKGQIAKDLGIVKRDDGTVYVTASVADIEGAALTYPILSFTDYSDSTISEDFGVYEPRMPTLSEVMSLKTIGPGHTKSSMSSSDLLEHIIYNACRMWCLNSIPGGFSSLRARAWTNVRNRSEFIKVRGKRFPKENTKIVEENPTKVAQQVYISEVATQAADCDSKIIKLGTEIGQHETVMATVELDAAESKAGFNRAKMELESFHATIQRLQLELKTAKQGARKSKSAMKKHDKAIEKNGWLLLGYEEVLGNLRQEHADTLENAANFRKDIKHAQGKLNEYEYLEKKEATAVEKKDYEEAARIRSWILELDGEMRGI